MYKNAKTIVQDITSYYAANNKTYGDITYIASKNSSFYSNVCINSMLFYTRTALYTTPYTPDCKYSDKNYNNADFGSYCSSLPSTSTGSMGTALDTINLLANKI